MAAHSRGVRAVAVCGRALGLGLLAQSGTPPVGDHCLGLPTDLAETFWELCYGLRLFPHGLPPINLLNF